MVARFAYNYLCLSHYPGLPGELSIVPNDHVASFKDLKPEAWHENMVLATALLPIMKKYAHNCIRDCGGCNTYTKSIGECSPLDVQLGYHLHTRIMPRTTVPLTPGWVDGNSCKLDYDCNHLYAFLTNYVEDLKSKVAELSMVKS